MGTSEEQRKQEKPRKSEKREKEGVVIKCPLIPNMEDTAVTRTLGREGATNYWG